MNMRAVYSSLCKPLFLLTKTIKPYPYRPPWNLATNLLYLKTVEQTLRRDKEVMKMLSRGGVPEKSSEIEDSTALRLEPLKVFDEREDEGDNPMWAGRTSQDWFFMDE